MHSYLYLHIHGSIWKWVSQFTGVTNFWYGLGISMTFSLYGHRAKELHKITEDLNNHKPNIEFTYTFSENYVPFLDLVVQLSGSALTTNLHIKPTDRH